MQIYEHWVGMLNPLRHKAEGMYTSRGGGGGGTSPMTPACPDGHRGQSLPLTVSMVGISEGKIMTTHK